ncbi:hypothetical protein PTNB73_08546 [Pyrenophora teres f. teres]|nr:hypothetical protein HRS9139_08658 [Pyrenophora teres f. teres]KAE8843876.1 hypothetical protein HRS9122_04979 [Pyrenophora teres f. teres]KAE8859066.1 hypothetical protein PTNB73_08546 [Pyrenophora teres f. teres]KAE8860931.1 hypothetical protein PTNB29_06026 [Pyrenophora teres f. teres]
MASFSALAAELLEYIVAYLPQRDIYAICQLDKYFHALAVPFLYCSVDLSISSNGRLPRIDRFCQNIINDRRKAKRVHTIRMGKSPGQAAGDGETSLPRDESFDDQLIFQKAMAILNDPILERATQGLQEAVENRQYAAYAALVLLLIPCLHRLEVAGHKFSPARYLYSTVSEVVQIPPGTSEEVLRHVAQSIFGRFSTIKEVSIHFDRKSGVAYSSSQEDQQKSLWILWNFTCVEKLEFSHDEFGLTSLWETAPHMSRHPNLDVAHLKGLVPGARFTTVVLRHSSGWMNGRSGMGYLLKYAAGAPSLTCDYFFDNEKQETRSTVISFQEAYFWDLKLWNMELRVAKEYLEVLVISAEYCDRRFHYFNQPRFEEKMHSAEGLKLSRLTRLHTLEVPLPFLTGDIDFSISKLLDPSLPPSLRHLILRPDLSHAQYPFPSDVSELFTVLTVEELKLEAAYMERARMDVLYMFETSLALLDQIEDLESFSVWQPGHEGLQWSDDQMEEFATACRDKDVTVNCKTHMPQKPKPITSSADIHPQNPDPRHSPIRSAAKPSTNPTAPTSTFPRAAANQASEPTPPKPTHINRTKPPAKMSAQSFAHHAKTPAAFSMRSPYKAYRSPFGPQYTIPKNYHGITANVAAKYGMLAAGFGGVAGFFALFFFAEVPKVRDDIMKKIPVLDKFFTHEIPPEDNPF